MSFTGESDDGGPASPNPYRDPVPWWTVTIGSQTIKAALTKFNGLEVKDEWKADKSKNTSGHVPKFAGTPGLQDILLTFAIVGGDGPNDLEAAADAFDDVVALYELMAPAPGSQYSATPASYPVPGQTAGVGSPSAQLVALANVRTDPNTGQIIPAADNAFGAASSSTSTEPNPGPRPPTLPISNAICAFFGVVSVARKSFKLRWDEASGAWECDLGLIQDQQPSPIAAGAMVAPVPATSISAALGLGTGSGNAGAAAGAT